VDLRRIGTLPPYQLGRLRELTLRLRRACVDVVDLGFGNPDLPPPAPVVRKLAAAVEDPRSGRRSAALGAFLHRQPEPVRQATV
jgi:alanine-synthesizing transaminase